jgi:hypothetical protein
MGKKRDRIIKKPRILGKIIRNRFNQPKITKLLTSNFYHLAIPTTNPSPYFLLSIVDYK